MSVYIKDEKNFKGVFATRSMTKGDIVISMTRPTSKLVRTPTRTSIQISEGHYVEDEIGACINHACKPSCEVRSFLVIASKDIEEGEEITFDYNKNEDVVVSPFKCNCCGKMILGRKHEQKTTESRDETSEV